MSVMKLGVSMMALALVLAQNDARAQEAAAPPPANPAVAEPVEELPPVVVTAPAKRNVKKAKLKAAGPVAPSEAPGAATSSTDTAPAPNFEASAALPGVVIEGEKVTRTLRDTTTSIGVVSGEQIRTQQIEDLQAALNTQANVMATKGQNGNSGFVIRGLNSEGLTNSQNPSAAPLISVVIDGATQNPEATRRGARGLWDVEQVEVLRGPQSALHAQLSCR